MVQTVRDMEVYQRAYKTALAIHRDTLKFPKEEQFALSSQIRRASKSICANLAEGFAKNHKSPAEFKRYCLIALGSSEEMLVWIDFAKDLEYITAQEWKTYEEQYRIVCKQISAMMDKWKT